MSRVLKGWSFRPRAVHLATLASVVSGLFGQATIIVTGVIAARVLGVEDRGHLALLVITAAGVCQLSALGVPLAATYEIASDGTRTRAVSKAILRLGLRQSIAAVLVHATLIYALARHASHDLKVAGAISVANSPAMVAQQYALAVLQGLGRFRAFNLLRLLPSVGYAAFAAAAWSAAFTSLAALTLTWTAASILAAIATSLVTSRAVAQVPAGTTTARDTLLERRMQVFGRKTVLASASPVETLRLDQAAVGLFLTPAALGLYVTAVAFTNLPRFVAQSIGIVAFPHVAAAASEKGARRILWRFTALTAVLCAMLVAALELGVPWLLPVLFGADFADAVPVARILLASAWFISVRRILTDAARGIGLPGAGTIAECVSWLSIIVMLPIVVPHGVSAVAWAMVGGALLSCVTLVWLVGRRSGPRSLTRSPGPLAAERPQDPAGTIG